MNSVSIQPQIYKTCSGERWITYLISINGIKAGYARCFCKAQEAATWLLMTL